MSKVGLGLILGMGAAAALAEPLSYEGFLDYTADGSAHGQTGGAGWDSPWDAQMVDKSYLISASAALEFGPLRVGGRGLSGGNAYNRMGRTLQVGLGGVWDKNGSVGDPHGTQGPGQINRGVVWVALLAKPVGASRQLEVIFQNNSVAWNQGQAGSAKFQSVPNGRWQVGLVDGPFQDTSVAAKADTTVLLVGRFEFKGKESTFHAWVFDRPEQVKLGGDDLALESAHVARTGLDAAALGFRSLSLYGDSGAGQAAFDEIRLGRTFADVTPAGEVSYAMNGQQALGNR